MLRYIKKRVNKSGEVVEGTGSFNEDGTTPNNSSALSLSGTSLADEVYRPPPPAQPTPPAVATPKSSDGGAADNKKEKKEKRKKKGRNKDSKEETETTPEMLQEQQRHLDETILSQKVEHLANFDACIEACDALAASTSLSSHNATSRRDPKTNIVDCSVLVSPDGDLLLMPQQMSQSQTALASASEAAVQLDSGSTHSHSHSHSQPQLSELGEDYESAIYVGNDLHTQGDKFLNGFSANGWSIPAASLALRQTEQSLHDFADFCEEIVLSKKESATKNNVACDKLRAVSFERGPTYPDDLQQDAALIMKQHNNFALTNQRVGPMFFNGGSLHRAQVKLEDFYAQMAESELDRWRLASLQRKGALPPLRKAATLAEERSSNRQATLREMYNRVQTMEDHLAACQALAATKWQLVEDAEQEVTRVIADRMKERNRKLEDARLKAFHEMGEQQETAVGGATNSEIWDIVSQVTSDIENGSFEPIPFSQSAAGRMATVTTVAAEESGAAGAGAAAASFEEGPEPPSRMDIEDEVGLGELRAAAFAADRMVQSASGSLLNVLSSLDQVRRSARISAETNLLSACNAQAACIKSIIRLERAALEERRQYIEELEEYAAKIDVREDLDKYINEDRKRPGGSAPLGQDDDGGVASALAVLYSHVEGDMGGDNMGSAYGSSNNLSAAAKISVAATVTPEALEEAIESLFQPNEMLEPDAPESDDRTLARDKFQAAVQLLCDVATEKSNAARPKRSRMCYAFNAKRSSNAEIKTPIQFDALCKVFSAILSGCDFETGGVSNAKMCMMLSQTFFFAEKGGSGGASGDGSGTDGAGGDDKEERSRRIYVKNRLIGHELWSNDEFWDQVLFQCLSESLTNSGVMSNFERSSSNNKGSQTEWREQRKTQWYDLSPVERMEAASQVHAVVFAQLSALAHSMAEFGCSLERSCAFVRRMSIRNQLPLSQRTILLQHLAERKQDSEAERVALLDSFGMQLESDGVPENETFNDKKPKDTDATDQAAENTDDNVTDVPEPRTSQTSLPDQMKSHLG